MSAVSPTNEGIISNADGRRGLDWMIPAIIAHSQHETLHWQHADFSVVVLEPAAWGGAQIAPLLCRRILEERSAAWRATNGSRHFFVIPHDLGVCTNSGYMHAWEMLSHHLIAHHVELSGHHWHYTNAAAPDLPCSVPTKDVSAPTVNRFIPPPPVERVPRASEKRVLLFYAGSGEFHANRHGEPSKRVGRYYLLSNASAWGSRSDAALSLHRVLSKTSFNEGMLHAQFCPIMGGYAPWTPRLVEAVLSLCVPVVFSSWVLPWSRVLAWEGCSIRVPSLTDIRFLPAILARYRYEDMRGCLEAVRSAMWFDLTPGRLAGDGALPFLLAEMHLAVRAAEAKPLANSMRQLFGLDNSQPFPRREQVAERVIYTNSSSGMRVSHCQLLIRGSTPEGVSSLNDSLGLQHVDGTICFKKHAIQRDSHHKNLLPWEILTDAQKLSSHCRLPHAGGESVHDGVYEVFSEDGICKSENRPWPTGSDGNSAWASPTQSIHLLANGILRSSTDPLWQRPLTADHLPQGAFSLVNASRLEEHRVAEVTVRQVTPRIVHWVHGYGYAESWNRSTTVSSRRRKPRGRRK